MSPTVPPISTIWTSTSCAHPADRRLDLVGDVGDHLDGAPEVVAAALARDDRVVDLARRDVVVPRHPRAGEPLVVAEVEIGLSPVVGDEDLPVLVGAHGSRIHVDVGIHLLEGDPEAAGFQEAADRGGGQPLSQGRHDPAGDEHVLGRHDQPPPLPGRVSDAFPRPRPWVTAPVSQRNAPARLLTCPAACAARSARQDLADRWPRGNAQRGDVVARRQRPESAPAPPAECRKWPRAAVPPATVARPRHGQLRHALQYAVRGGRPAGPGEAGDEAWGVPARLPDRVAPGRREREPVHPRLDGRAPFGEGEQGEGDRGVGTEPRKGPGAERRGEPP